MVLKGTMAVCGYSRDGITANGTRRGGRYKIATDKGRSLLNYWTNK